MNAPLLRSITPEKLQNKISRGLSMLTSCRVCPRDCEVNRQEEELGFCKIGRLARVASYTLHFGEEDVLVGQGGSGTIFFGGCNLCCVFCQNYDISFGAHGKKATPAGLAEIMIELQNSGAENINFVTPSHVVPQIIEALPLALDSGLSLPLVYNCGGYESLETLRLLEGIVDIYMPDTKFFHPEQSKKYCQSSEYPERARESLREMHRQVGDLAIDRRGVATRGLLVRHLLMPDNLAGTEEWMQFIAREISPDTYVNIMNQYRPCARAHTYPELTRSVSLEEYEKALDDAREAGIHQLDRAGYRLAEKMLRRLLSD